MSVTGPDSKTTLFLNKNSINLLNLPNNWAELWALICTMHLTVCSSDITYAFKSESTLYIDLNVKEFLTQNRLDIWRLSDCNWPWIHNHLVCQLTFNRLATLTKWLNWIVSTYPYGTFKYMFLSCHVRVSEWIHTLYLNECQRTRYLKMARYLKFKSVQRASNPKTLSS